MPSTSNTTYQIIKTLGFQSLFAKNALLLCYVFSRLLHYDFDRVVTMDTKVSKKMS